ncbi:MULTISPECIES: threonine ammonia-lyase [Fusobacterium]|jgi:threonine dehydratase|uniref:threonine ammonia-lyase n=2 Tax=Fusobacterium TaxID=848 RepID=A0A7G9GUB3_9FUSO|nr:threonine ammonia-lyase [Fusobacterium hominis]
MVTLETINKARENIRDSIKKTPLVECPTLEKQIGGQVFFKLENLQKTGSFKIRGALNRIANLTEEEKKRGVIASSAGNHAQGIALGATAQGIKSTIVMPETAPIAKVTATKNYGAEVVLHGQVYDDAYAKAKEIEKETGAVFLHPFDDEYVISGQGTIGIEILEDEPDIDVVLVPIGGGGILAGIATAVKSLKPNIKVIGVEAANAPSMTEALKRGECCDICGCGTTIADGIAVRKVGCKTLELAKKYVDEVVTVTEQEIADAILFLMEKSKVVAEGAGAAPLAAILAGKVDCKGKKVCAVVSGGNIDVNLIERVLNRALIHNGRRYEFKVDLNDKIGEAEKVLRILSANRANVLYLTQSVYRARLGIAMQELTIVIECSDMDHRNEVIRNMKAAGYSIYE